MNKKRKQPVKASTEVVVVRTREAVADETAVVARVQMLMRASPTTR